MWKQRQNTKKNHYKPFKAMVINFQSIKGKTAGLHNSLDMDNPDIVIGTETWINTSILSNKLFPDSYTVYRKDRPPNKKGISYGGVLIAVRNNFTSVQKHNLDTDCEILWCEIRISGSKPVLIGSYYRPPVRTVNT